MRNKLFSLVLAGMMLISLVGCGEKDDSEGPASVTTPESTVTPSVEPTPESTPTESIEELCDSYKEHALQIFDECEVVCSGNNVTVYLLSDGIADSLYSIVTSGNVSEWDILKENIVGLAKDWEKSARDAGYSDISIKVEFQNDTNPDESLLIVSNEGITYDIANDEEAVQKLAPIIPDPVVYTGSGSDVISVELLSGGCVFHITGNQAGKHFAVKGYDAEGNRIGLFVNTTDPYDGVTMDMDQETAMMEVTATGDWTIELQPLSLVKTISSGETVSGEGDSVVRILDYGTTATILGNAGEHHFSVKSYGTERNNLMVNTTDKYEGTVMLTGNPVLLEITAEGEWSIAFN